MEHVGSLRLEVRSPTHFAAGCSRRHARVIVHSAAKLDVRAVSSIAGAGGKVSDKPSICTADELHYVPVPDSPWRLALWRYRPSSPVGIKRNHPLLLLSGLGTNAIGYDLAPGSSFARFMSLQGFDTWILEVRGSGLSVNNEISFTKVQKSEAVSRSDDFLLREKLKDANLLNEGLAQARLDSVANQVRNWSQKLGNIFAEGQKSVALQEQFSLLIDDFQKQLDLILKYNWDFDHYLEEDVPAAVRWSMSGPILNQWMISCLQLATPWEVSCYMQCFLGMVTKDGTLSWHQLLHWDHLLITLLQDHHLDYCYP